MRLSHFMKKSIVLWVCSVLILSMTGLVIWLSKYGIAAIFFVFICAIAFLQIYKICYQWFARHRRYNTILVRRITNCWIIYLILDISFCVGVLFSMLFYMAENEVLGISKLVYCIIIIVLAVLLTLIPIQPYVNKQEYPVKKHFPARLINAFVPRFVILYTFVVYYFLSFVDFTTSKQIIPSLCVVYIGIERMITMFTTIKQYYKQEYVALYKDTAKWIKRSSA